MEFSEEDFERMANLGIAQDRIAELRQKYSRMEGIRDQVAPQGIQAGRTFVAASPLSFIGRGIQQYKAGKRMGELDQQIGGLQDQVRDGRAQMMRGIMGPSQPARPAQPAGAEDLRRRMLAGANYRGGA